MFFELFKKLKTKTLLVVAGFLVLAGIFGFSLWVYFSFLKSDEAFLDAVPAEAVMYWHNESFEDDSWLWAITRSVLSDAAAEQIKFLEEKIAPEADKAGFAVLPDFSDFIFFGQIDAAKFEERKSRLEELNYHYVSDEGGRVIISNTKFGLLAAVATLNQEGKSLADETMKMIAFNGARRASPAQIYFGSGAIRGDFPAVPLKSDFWERNKLTAGVKDGVEMGKNFSDFNFLAVLENKYLRKNTEKVFKDDLAVLLPQIQDKILPDGTEVKEIFANPDIFVFRDEKINSAAIRFLSVPVLNQEFLVFEESRRTTVSNLTEMTQKFLKDSRRQPDYYGKNLRDLMIKLTPDFFGIVFGVD